MVRQIFQKFGFTSDGCVADSWGNHSVLVKDSEQIDNMGFRDLIHEIYFTHILKNGKNSQPCEGSRAFRRLSLIHI